MKTAEIREVLERIEEASPEELKEAAREIQKKIVVRSHGSEFDGPLGEWLSAINAELILRG